MEVVDFQDAKSNCGSVWSSGDVVSMNIQAAPSARERTVHRKQRITHNAQRTTPSAQRPAHNA